MSPRKKVGFVGITSRAAMMVAAGCLVLSYLSIFFNPAKAWVMTIFGLLYVPFLLLNMFLLVWAAVRRSRAILIPLIALVPSLFLFGRYFQFSSPEPADERGVKIVSYNVGRFSSAAKRLGIENRQECEDSVVRYLRSLDADIICLQEVRFGKGVSIKSWTSKNFPGYEAEYFVFSGRNVAYGNVTLSRFPLLDKGKLDFEKSSNLAIWAEYEVAGEPLRVYNCHFQSYNISLSRLVSSLRGDYKRTVHDTEEKMKSSIKIRPRQVQTVIGHIENSRTRSIVAGDFNDNPLSYTYWRLSRGRKDSFVEAGKGAGATFTGLWPLLRIDYILFPDEFGGLSHSVPHRKYSDHYPVIAEISI